MCCSELQCVAVSCRKLQCIAKALQFEPRYVFPVKITLQCESVAVCFSVLQ